MNVGMIIGSDGKLNVILNTLKILSHKCKTIVICDTGNWIINPSIEEKIKFFKNVKYIPCGDVGSYFLFECHKIIQRNLPLGEWFLYLDADERPCSNLLDDWDGITNKLDELKIEIGAIAGSPHFYGRRLPPTVEYFETTDRGAENRENLFIRKNIIKNCGKVIAVHVGNHTDWVAPNDMLQYVGNGFYGDKSYYWIHIKSSFQKAHGHVMCAHNIYDINWYLPDENIECKKLSSLNYKYGLKSTNNVSQYIIDHNDYPEEILEYMFDLGCNSTNASVSIFCGVWSLYMLRIFNKIEDGEYQLRKHRLNESIKKFDENYVLLDITIDSTKSPKDRYIFLLNGGNYCGHKCCKYGNIQL